MDQLLSMRVFVRVVDVGSFARTADQLDMSRAMVTTHVATLERRLGVRLLNRTTRRISLTDDGRGYYDRCVKILEEISEAEDAIAGSLTVARGQLRVEMPIAFARHWLVPALPRFLAKNPELVLRIGLNNRPVDLLAEGFDCAVRTGTPSDSSFIARRVGTLRAIAVASPAYLRSRGTPRHPDDLANHNCIVWLSPQSMQAMPWQFERKDQKRLVHVTGNLGVNAMEDAAAAALQGIGIARTLAKLVRPALRRRQLRQVLAGWSMPEQPVWLIYPHRRHLPAKLRAFADFLADTLVND